VTVCHVGCHKQQPTLTADDVSAHCVSIGVNRSCTRVRAAFCRILDPATVCVLKTVVTPVLLHEKVKVAHTPLLSVGFQS